MGNEEARRPRPFSDVIGEIGLNQGSSRYLIYSAEASNRFSIASWDLSVKSILRPIQNPANQLDLIMFLNNKRNPEIARSELSSLAQETQNLLKKKGLLGPEFQSKDLPPEFPETLRNLIYVSFIENQLPQFSPFIQSLFISGNGSGLESVDFQGRPPYFYKNSDSVYRVVIDKAEQTVNYHPIDSFFLKVDEQIPEQDRALLLKYKSENDMHGTIDIVDYFQPTAVYLSLKDLISATRELTSDLEEFNRQLKELRPRSRTLFGRWRGSDKKSSLYLLAEKIRNTYKIGRDNLGLQYSYEFNVGGRKVFISSADFLSGKVIEHSNAPLGNTINKFIPAMMDRSIKGNFLSKKDRKNSRNYIDKNWNKPELGEGPLTQIYPLGRFKLFMVPEQVIYRTESVLENKHVLTLQSVPAREIFKECSFYFF